MKIYDTVTTMTTIIAAKFPYAELFVKHLAYDIGRLVGVVFAK